MKNNKGFTLIELLAVIVILAIILIIAVPRITKLIEESQKKTLVSSIKLLGRGVEQDSTSTNQTEYKLSSTGKLIDSSGKEIVYNGKLVSKNGDTTLQIDEKGVVKIKVPGNICNEKRTFCTNYFVKPVNELSQVDLIKSGSSSAQRVVLKEGNIENDLTLGTVKYTLYSDGLLKITATEDGVIRDDFTVLYDVLYPFLNEYIVTPAEERTERLQEQANELAFRVFSTRLPTVEAVVLLLHEGYGMTYNALYELVEDQMDELFGVNGVQKYNDMFSAMPQVTALELGEGLKVISKNTFHGIGITNVNLPSTLTKILDNSFSGNHISSITIPADVITIGNEAFADNPISSVTIKGVNPQRFNTVWDIIGFPLNQSP